MPSKVKIFFKFMATALSWRHLKQSVLSMPFVGLFLTGCLSAYQFIFFVFFFHSIACFLTFLWRKTLFMLRMFSSGIWCIAYHQLVAWRTRFSAIVAVSYRLYVCQTLLCGQDEGKIPSHMCGRGLTVDGRTAEEKEKTPSLNCILEEECSGEAQETLAKTPKQKLPDAQRLINAHTLVECEAVRRSGKHSSSYPTARLQRGRGGWTWGEREPAGCSTVLYRPAQLPNAAADAARLDVMSHAVITLPQISELSAGCCDEES